VSAAGATFFCLPAGACIRWGLSGALAPFSGVITDFIFGGFNDFGRNYVRYFKKLNYFVCNYVCYSMKHNNFVRNYALKNGAVEKTGSSCLRQAWASAFRFRPSCGLFLWSPSPLSVRALHGVHEGGGW
jgi:hypothetical protein